MRYSSTFTKLAKMKSKGGEKKDNVKASWTSTHSYSVKKLLPFWKAIQQATAEANIAHSFFVPSIVLPRLIPNKILRMDAKI